MERGWRIKVGAEKGLRGECNHGGWEWRKTEEGEVVTNNELAIFRYLEQNQYNYNIIAPDMSNLRACLQLVITFYTQQCINHYIPCLGLENSKLFALFFLI